MTGESTCLRVTPCFEQYPAQILLLLLLYRVIIFRNVTRSQSVIKRERVSKIQIPRFEETADHPSVHIFGAAAEKLKKLKTTPIKNRPSWRRDWAAFRGREAEEWRGEGNARERKR